MSSDTTLDDRARRDQLDETLGRRLAAARVVPVLTIDDAARAVPLVRALADGGLGTVEITLRTPAALDAIRRVTAEVPGVLVGAGSIGRPEELAAVREAGAVFAVSAGFTRELSAAAAEAALPWLPGVATPSEALAARAAGHRTLKLFPARETGGVGWLDAVRGPLPDLRFCPTGGLAEDSWRAYLERPNVVAVAGSWMVDRDRVAAADWRAIAAAATAVADAARAAGSEERTS